MVLSYNEAKYGERFEGETFTVAGAVSDNVDLKIEDAVDVRFLPWFEYSNRSKKSIVRMAQFHWAVRHRLRHYPTQGIEFGRSY